MSDRPMSAILADAAAAAGHAPSVHNTQPWRWRVSSDVLHLFADRGRQLRVADPDGRMLTLSCGAALHHARVALAAEGWQAQVIRLPGSDDGDHMASIVPDKHIGITLAAMRQFQALRLRHTHRGPVAPSPVPQAAVDEVRHVAEAEGTHFHVLTPDQVSELAVASARADQIEVTDPQQRLELAYWIGGSRPEGTGLPDAVIPQSPAQTVVAGRDFVRSGSLETGPGHDREATYAVLFGSADTPDGWLKAGQALSAVWLTAQELGVTVLPFSAVIEVKSTRESLRRVLSGIGYPYLVLRLGAPQAPDPGDPHAPRLSAQQTIEIIEHA